MAKKLTNAERMPTHQEIEQRAHEIYERSGRISGRDLDNWLQAEAELCAGRPQAQPQPQSPAAAKEIPPPAAPRPEPRPGSRSAGRAVLRRQ